MRLASVFAVTAVAYLSSVTTPALAGDAMSPDDLRLYCGYLEQLQDESVQKLRPNKRLDKIARLAKVKPRTLSEIVKRGETWGDSCDAMMRQAEKDIMATLQETSLKGRVEFVEVSGEEWDQMIVRIRWKGDEDRLVEEEAATAAWATFHRFPMVKTMACAAYNPLNKDESLFEGIIANARMANIDKGRIDTFADTRYIRLFDNKKFAKPRP